MACNCGCEGIEIPQGLPGATGATGPAGATGAAGTNGTNGTNGVGILYNSISNSSTTGTTLETLKTYQLPAAKLTTNGDMICIKARFSTSTETTVASTKTVTIYFNGSLIASSTLTTSNINAIEFEIYLSRYDNTTGKYQVYTNGFYDTISLFAGQFNGGIVSAGGLNFTTTAYNIDAKANSDVIGDLTCEYLQVTLYKA